MQDDELENSLDEVLSYKKTDHNTLRSKGKLGGLRDTFSKLVNTIIDDEDVKEAAKEFVTVIETTIIEAPANLIKSAEELMKSQLGAVELVLVETLNGAEKSANDAIASIEMAINEIKTNMKGKYGTVVDSLKTAKAAAIKEMNEIKKLKTGLDNFARGVTEIAGTSLESITKIVGEALVEVAKEGKKIKGHKGPSGSIKHGHSGTDTDTSGGSSSNTDPLDDADTKTDPQDDADTNTDTQDDADTNTDTTKDDSNTNTDKRGGSNTNHGGSGKTTKGSKNGVVPASLTVSLAAAVLPVFVFVA